MIFKSFQILAICTSMAVTPSNFHYDQVKKANEDTTYTNTIEYTYKAGSVNNLAQDSIAETFKYSGQSLSDAFLVNSNAYSNTYYQDQSLATITYNTLKPTSSSILYVLQITPYNQTINNNLNINLRVRIQPWIQTDPQTYYTFTMYTRQFTSTEEYWAKYIDASNITNPTFNYDAIQDITNSQLGFTYTEKTMSQNLIEDYSFVTIPTQITIDPNKTNYAYFYIYNIYESEQVEGVTSRLTNSSTKLFDPTGSGRNVTITGTILHPISGYEVVDIPGIMWEVLSMPFTFISIAFNLTLFPNTPYQVNLSNLFLSILGALIFIFIMSKFVFKK